MLYAQLYEAGSEALAGDKPLRNFGSLLLRKLHHTSTTACLLPGDSEYSCSAHQCTFESAADNVIHQIGTQGTPLHVHDSHVEQNQAFPYYIVMPDKPGKARRVIFLFHGFNEKSWDKYLPWAYALSRSTGAAVVLFPIAFHMNRAPAEWSEKRAMFELSRQRRKQFPEVCGSSLSNVAISMRLHALPQRFVWSGLQSFYDVVDFIGACKAGTHPYIHPDFAYDIFAYSIGGMLAQILKMANPKNFFTHSKVALFCSGAVFNRLSPVSKFILDSEANVALYAFLVEHLDYHRKTDPRLAHYLSPLHPEGHVLHTMLSYQKMRGEREELLRQVASDIYAVGLKKDTVIPTFEMMNTLQGAFRDIPIPVDQLEFDYPYTHENPFPLAGVDGHTVDAAFVETFDKLGRFLSNGQ
ncbi:MAG: DUF6051 family protein [Bacteroidales bacterium]